MNLLKSPINNKKHKNQVGIIKHYLNIVIKLNQNNFNNKLNFYYFYNLYTYVRWLQIFNLNNHQVIKIKIKKKVKKILILLCF